MSLLGLPARVLATGTLALCACTLASIPPCPAPNLPFQPLTLQSSLATWDGATSVFDGKAIWVAYSLTPLGSAQAADIFLTQVTCQGTTGVNPGESTSALQLNLGLAEGRRPVLATAGESVLAAWSTFPSPLLNLTTSDVVVTGFAPAQLVVPPVTPYSFPTTLGASTFVGDAQVSGVSAALGSGNEYILSGSRKATVETVDGGVTNTACETPFTQWSTVSVSRDGGTTSPTGGSGDAEPADATAGCNVGSPQVSAGEVTEPVYLAWEQIASDGTGPVDGGSPSLVFAKLDPTTSTFGPSSGLVTGELTDISVAYGVLPTSTTATRPHYLAVGQTTAGASQILVFDMSVPTGVPMSITLGADTPQRPYLAGAEGGGAVAYATTLADGTTTMAVQQFSDTSGRFATTGTLFRLSDMAAVNSGRIEGITYLSGTSYVVLWSELSSSTATTRTLRSAFITF